MFVVRVGHFTLLFCSGRQRNVQRFLDNNQMNARALIAIACINSTELVNEFTTEDDR